MKLEKNWPAYREGTNVLLQVREPSGLHDVDMTLGFGNLRKYICKDGFSKKFKIYAYAEQI